MNTSPLIAFGLGSNLGDRAAQLGAARAAFHALPYIDNTTLAYSPLIETPALLPEHAPPTWNIPYLNQVVVARLHPSDNPHLPEALLTALKEIERALGRQDRGHWSPREIDIDILTIEGITWDCPTLTLPHPAAHTRLFVLAPLVHLWAEAPLAGGIPAAQYLMQLHGNTPLTWWEEHA